MNLYFFYFSGDKYDLGTISVNSSGEYRWINESLKLDALNKVFENKLYSSNNIIDSTNGSILNTYDSYPYIYIWFENGSYMRGSEKTTVTGNGTSILYNASGDEVWSANYGSPKAIIDNYVLTSEATLNLSDGTKFSDVGLNEKYTTDIDHRLHGKDIWDGDSDRINVTDVTTGATRVVLNNIDEYYDYVVAEKQNILIYQSRDTKEMVAYNTQTMAELWRLTYDPSKLLHEAIYFNPDQSRFYFTNSTSDLISFNTLTGSLVWNKSEICSKVIGFSDSDGTIYCKSRYATSLEDYADNYLVAIKP